MSTIKLGTHFLANGHDVAVFSFANEGHEDGLPLKIFSGEEEGGQTASNLAQLVDILQRFKPDIVINQMPYEHTIGQVLNDNKNYLLLGCLRNTLYSVKGNLDGYINRALPTGIARWFHNPIGRRLFLARHRRRHREELLSILSTYDHFVMFGPPNLEELEYFVPEYDQNCIRLIPNSIPAVAEGVYTKEKRLLWLGRVANAQKRAELILPIWKQVSADLKDWALDVVGDGPELAALKAEARNQSLKRIRFHGRQIPDDYYRRASIFFMTSAFEGFPNTLIEAQSFGAIPVVFDSYPMASWIVQDGASGFLIRPFDVDAMAERIVKLAKDPDRSKFAEGALESVRRFHIDRVGEMWQQLFESSVPKYIAPDRPKKVV